jgi:hypothetical protein
MPSPHPCNGGATQLAAIKDEWNGQSSPFGSRAPATLACGFASGGTLTYVVAAFPAAILSLERGVERDDHGRDARAGA